MDKYPLTKIIIEKDLSEIEYHEFMQFVHRLNDEYEKQKAEGLLDFSSLLIQFAGMLNEKLDPNQMIDALHKEGYYPNLMNEFLSLLQRK